MSDSLLPRVASGDATAVAAVMDRYANLVWSLASRFTANRSDAEDAVQEIFIDLWSNAARFDSAKASETTFVAMIARRRLIDRLRKAGRQPGLEQLETAAGLGDPAPGPENLEVRDEASRAARLIESLKPVQQEVIRLAVYDGYSHQGIADKLGLPLGTVKTHLRRGLLRVREGMR